MPPLSGIYDGQVAHLDPPVDDPPPPRSNWGLEIKKIREEQGLSQRRLAKLAGVDRSCLLRFENGQTLGNMETIERLVEVLGYEFELMRRGFPDGFSSQPLLPGSVA